MSGDEAFGVLVRMIVALDNQSHQKGQVGPAKPRDFPPNDIAVKMHLKGPWMQCEKLSNATEKPANALTTSNEAIGGKIRALTGFRSGSTK